MSLYVKVTIDEKLDEVSGFKITDVYEKALKWTPEKSDDKDDEPSDISDVKCSSFGWLFHDFERSMESFVTAVPFIMSSMPLVVKYYTGSNIRGYLKEFGQKEEDGDGYEIYSAHKKLYSELKMRGDKCRAIYSGVASMPGMFLMGLVSAYDCFFGNLVRAIYLSQPDLLSSSDKNISFKDLVEVGSVEAMREKIIDKEVESVMRSSHADQVAWIEKTIRISDLRKNDLWPEFIEVFERRNLITHTG